MDFMFFGLGVRAQVNTGWDYAKLLKITKKIIFAIYVKQIVKAG